MKQTLTIEVEVPDWAEIEGYEQNGSSHTHGKLTAVSVDVKLRQRWEPQPLTLKPGWIFSNDGKTWVWTESEPYESLERHWDTAGRFQVVTTGCNFTPPTWTDAKSSLREIR